MEELSQREKEIQRNIREYLRSGDLSFAAAVGTLYASSGNAEEAEKWYRKTLVTGLKKEVYMQVAEFYLSVGKFAKATDIYQLFLFDLPQTEKMRFADLLTEAKAYKFARELYEQMKSLPSAEPSYITPIGKYRDKEALSTRTKKYITLGDRCFGEGDTERAAGCYAKATEESFYAYSKLGECEFLNGNYEKAKNIFRNIVQSTDHPHFMVMLGECYCNQPADPASYERAVYWFEYALEKDSAEAYYHLGMCYQLGLGTERDEEKALALYEEGAKREFDKGACLCKLGNYYYQKGEWKKSLEYYERAIALGEARAYVNIAVCAYNERVRFFSKDQLLCYLYKAAALGDGYAAQLLSKGYFNERT